VPNAACRAAGKQTALRLIHAIKGQARLGRKFRLQQDFWSSASATAGNLSMILGSLAIIFFSSSRDAIMSAMPYSIRCSERWQPSGSYSRILVGDVEGFDDRAARRHLKRYAHQGDNRRAFDLAEGSGIASSRPV
jgi:hypothetical protein